MWIFFAIVPLARLRSLRKEFLMVHLNTMIAPFGAIDFLHLSWGSINTNMNTPAVDSIAVLCLYTSNQLATPCPLPCVWQAKFAILFRFITIFLRAMQNGRRYSNSGFTVHIAGVNLFLNLGHNVAAAVLLVVDMTTGRPTAN